MSLVTKVLREKRPVLDDSWNLGGPPYGLACLFDSFLVTVQPDYASSG